MIPNNDKPPLSVDSNKKTFVAWVLAAFSVSTTLSVVIFLFLKPLNAIAAAVQLFFFSAPVAIGLHFILKQYLQDKIDSSPNPEIVRIYFMITLVLLPFSALTFANSQFDSSLPTKHELLVSDKYSISSEGSTSHFVEFKSPAGPNCCFLPEESGSVRVMPSEFEKVVVGQTKIVVQMKKGLIGLPWIESHALKNDPTHNDLERDEAISWMGEAVKEDATEFQEERWPGGQLKAKAPIIHGQVHGEAMYWHPNGQLYARIPFKNGKEKSNRHIDQKFMT